MEVLRAPFALTIVYPPALLSLKTPRKPSMTLGASDFEALSTRAGQFFFKKLKKWPHSSDMRDSSSKKGLWNECGSKSRAINDAILRFYSHAVACSGFNDASRPCESRISELCGHFFLVIEKKRCAITRLRGSSGRR
ncbi:hypothetical protein [uncultured Enorma sp.]|uniref:hypothetical protein n=1 Tax=uncultured Enorma sp. TaxID=1714346 RepID=UPI0028040931|nr:hypothetical protein [uncultured Enorma sp.]